MVRSHDLIRLLVNLSVGRRSGILVGAVDGRLVQLYCLRMSCVIDTSAIIAVLLSEPERAALIRATKGAELVAPASVHWEIGMH